jgi:FMN phosphatase YigB (HAD superfamily)
MFHKQVLLSQARARLRAPTGSDLHTNRRPPRGRLRAAGAGGLVADVQYADIDDGASFDGSERRCYRRALEHAAAAARVGSTAIPATVAWDCPYRRLHYWSGVDAAFYGDNHDALATGAIDADAFVAAAAAALAAHGDDVDAGAVRDAWARVVAWRPGGPALLAACAAQITTWVWSNTDLIHWSVLGSAIDGVVARAVTSFGVGALKPDPAFYRRALAGTGVDAGDVLFVDDRADNVAAARALGIDAVVVTSVGEARALLAARGVRVEA